MKPTSFVQNRPEGLLQLVLLLLILTGALLAVWQFIFNRSLWYDEALLAPNIIQRDFRGLAEPLENWQVAPIGFLWATKLSVSVLGENEYALRIFPLIAFFIAIPLFYMLANQLSGNTIIALLSTSIFSTSRVLIGYSSELKPYSVDVMCALLILYLSFALRLDKSKSLLIYAAAGGLAVWFSNAAIVILTICGVRVFYGEVYKKKNYKIVYAFLLWLASFSLYYAAFIYDHPYRNFVVSLSRKYFLPLNPLSNEFYGFLLNALKGMYLNLSFGPFWPIPLMVSLFAAGFLVKRRRYSALYIFLAPTLVHLALSGLMLYPFIRRLILYITPMTILIYGIGLCALFDFVRNNVLKLSRWVLIIPALIMFYPLGMGFPIEREELRKSMEYLRKNIRSDESVYIYYGAYPAFAYYKDRMGISNPVVVGRAHPRKRHLYDGELSSLKGRIYLLFSHVYPYTPEDNEESYMVDFLVKRGGVVLDMQKHKGSSVYYLDTKKP